MSERIRYLSQPVAIALIGYGVYFCSTGSDCPFCHCIGVSDK